MFLKKLAGILIALSLFLAPFLPMLWAQVAIPPAGEAGLSEKSLRQSQPQPQLPPVSKKPDITVIEDSRELGDAGAGSTFLVNKVEIEDNTVFDEETLAPLVDVGKGLEMTLGVLSLMAQEISAYYAERGYFLAKAYVPAQEIKDGVVKMTVSEGKIGEIKTSGNQKISSEDIVRRLGKARGEKVLREQTLERILLDLNDLMGVKVRSVLTPGELPGTSDLMLEITETAPYSFGFDVDNFGSRFTGRNRMGVTAVAGNVAKFADQLSFRGVRSDLGQNFGQIAYLFPLTDSGDTTLKFSATHSEQTLGATLASLNAGGQSDIYTAEAAHVLYRSKTASLRLRGGLDTRYFKNFQLGQLSSKDEIHDGFISIGGNVIDSFSGMTFFDLKAQRGLGGTGLGDSLPSRAQGKSEITLAQLNVNRFQSTNFMNSYFALKAGGQITSNRTLSPDLYAVGGMGTVRGYPLSEFSGDHGYTASAEYFFPIPSQEKFGVDDLTISQVISLSAFLDHGKVFVKDKQSGDKDQAISSAGMGVQINLPKAKTGWRPAVAFSLVYAAPVFGSLNPTDGSYGTWYANGAINF